MTERSPDRRADAVLALAALGIGAAIAAAYAAWRAVSEEGASSGARWSEFGDALVFPGLLITIAVAAMVWFGWKANID
jgi:hypothetical protein